MGFKPFEEKTLKYWIETIYWLPREKAREAAREYFNRYPPLGYETYIHHWHETLEDKIYLVMRRRINCD